MGLGDMLIKMGYKYGSDSVVFIEDIYRTIAIAAVTESLKMAESLGSYPMCKHPEILTESSFIKNLHLSEDLLVRIRKSGLYNSQLLTCAPTGSLSSMFSISGGVEPNFAFSYNRRTVSLEKEEKIFKVDTKIVSDYRLATNNFGQLPEYFVSSQNINPFERIEVQAALQKYIDASISSTINLPESTTIDDVFNIYMSAWKHHLKGITIWRDNCQRQGILTTTPSQPVKEELHFDHIIPKTREDLGEVLSGETYKHKTACGTLYITINKDQNGNVVEIFTNSSKNGTCKANLNGETRMASLALRAGVKVEEVIDQLKGIHCQSCAFARAKGNKIDGTSCPDIISKCLQKSYDTKVRLITESKENIQEHNDSEHSQTASKCPECGKELRHEGGCVVCECGYSKCE